jgi:aryl-alcohol dehydrogenase-like predicted oxidoreductase
MITKTDDVKAMIKRLQDSFNETLNVLYDLPQDYLRQPCAHGCARGGTARDLLVHNIFHEKQHTGQVWSVRDQLRLLQGWAGQDLPALLADYYTSRAQLIAALFGLADDQLDAKPKDGGWSIRETIEHVLYADRDSIDALHAEFQGLQVTKLGYGAMELRGVPRGRDVTDAQAETILHAVLDAGINYIDTSIDYGVSEERIGRYISQEQGALDTVLELKRAGTIRFVGMSGTLPNLPDHIAMGVFDVFQIPYSAVEREHEALITAAAKAGAGIVIRGGAAKGAPTEGKRDGVQWERWQRVQLADLLGGMTSMEFILRFTFTHPDMHTNIVGTIDPVHLRHNVDVVRQGPLPADVYAEAKRRFDAAGSTLQGV